MNERKKLKIGAFQFAASSGIERNLAALQRGIAGAAEENVRLLLTQECALCGYPPVECPSVQAIDQDALSEAFQEISSLAQRFQIYIALGTVMFGEAKPYNSIRLLAPDGRELPPYHKRALWGWDRNNFQPGRESGIYSIDGIRVGVRICFEVRFPEYFRELLLEQVELALVSFADVSPQEQVGRLNTIRSHLVSRAAENVMYVASASSTSQKQLAPTCVVDPDGNLVAAAPLNEEHLLTAEIVVSEPGFGRQGRLEYSRTLTARTTGFSPEQI